MEDDVQRRLEALEANLFGANGSNGIRMKVRDLETAVKAIADRLMEEKEEKKSNDRVRKGLITTVLGAIIVAFILQAFAAIKASATQSMLEVIDKKLDAASQEVRPQE